MKSADGTLNIVWSSDHHLLSLKTPTSHILNNLSNFFYKDTDLSKVDLIIFGGDFFHRLVESNNKEFILISNWVKKFLLKCKENDVIVRVLEGTSSHDWEQPEHFEILKPKNGNVRWVSEITIEHIKELDLNLLYVPDNMGALSPDEVWGKVVDKLVLRGLQQVDLTAFHGAFKYQLPEHISKHTHLESNYESITKYGIFAGHIHTPSKRGKIYVSGSFDRTAHGEEHPKGGYHISLNKRTNAFLPKFYVNKNALPFITIKISPLTTITELTLKLESLISDKLMHGARIRVKGGDAVVVNSVIGRFRETYQYYGFDIENDVQGVTVDETLYDNSVYEGVVITKDNIHGMLFTSDFIGGKDGNEVEELKKILKEHL